jgi:hypothetical protein
MQRLDFITLFGGAAAPMAELPLLEAAAASVAAIPVICSSVQAAAQWAARYSWRQAAR